MVAAVSPDQNASALERGTAAGGLVLASAASSAVWYFDPSTSNFFPVCPLYTFTGFACPGCGLTRGFHALFHGDMWTALDYNALIPLFVLAFAFVLVTLASVALRGKGLIKLSASPKFLFGSLCVLFVFGILRNLPFYPFSVLYP